VLLQVDDKPFKVEVSFLLICVNMVRPVLGKSIELSCVVEYTLIPLLKVQEFLQLGAEQTRRKYRAHPMGHGDQQVGRRCRKPTRLQLSLEVVVLHTESSDTLYSGVA
jgi:hypothetical protein